MNLRTLKELCQKAEDANRMNSLIAPDFLVKCKKKPESESQKNMLLVSLFGGLSGEIVLSGFKNTPTIVRLKCKDVRKFVSNFEKEWGEIS